VSIYIVRYICSRHISGGLKGVQNGWRVPRWCFLKALRCLSLCQIYLSRHLVSSRLCLQLFTTTALFQHLQTRTFQSAVFMISLSFL